MSMSRRIGDPLTGCEDIVTSFGSYGSAIWWGLLEGVGSVSIQGSSMEMSVTTRPI